MPESSDEEEEEFNKSIAKNPKINELPKNESIA